MPFESYRSAVSGGRVPTLRCLRDDESRSIFQALFGGFVGPDETLHLQGGLRRLRRVEVAPRKTRCVEDGVLSSGQWVNGSDVPVLAPILALRVSNHSLPMIPINRTTCKSYHYPIFWEHSYLAIYVSYAGLMWSDETPVFQSSRSLNRWTPGYPGNPCSRWLIRPR